LKHALLRGDLKQAKYSAKTLGAAQQEANLGDLNAYIRGVGAVWREIATCKYRKHTLMKQAGCVSYQSLIWESFMAARHFCVCLIKVYHKALYGCLSRLCVCMYVSDPCRGFSDRSTRPRKRPELAPRAYLQLCPL
jgi:hypothetical protein